jgi:hypothetical protein
MIRMAVNAENIQSFVKDAFYVTVGLGVIGFQRAQVQRQELRKQLETQLGDARHQLEKAGKTLEDRVKVVEERLEGVEDRFETLFEQFEERLPEQARELVKQARDAAKEARGQLRALAAGRTNGSGSAAA